MNFEAGRIARRASEMKRRVNAPTHSFWFAHVVRRAREYPNAH
jgi:hypothetical protein